MENAALTAPFNNMRTLTPKDHLTNPFSQLLPASDYCRARGNQIVHRSDNETVFSSCRKLGGAAKHLIDGSENRICPLSFEFESLHVMERCSNSWSFHSSKNSEKRTNANEISWERF